MKTSKRVLAVFSAVCIAASMSVPVFAAESGEKISMGTKEHQVLIGPLSENNTASEALRGTVHCRQGTKIGYLITKTGRDEVGTDVRQCTHGGGIDAKDYRTQYQEWIEYTCTLCDYHYRAVTNTYWTDWTCGN